MSLMFLSYQTNAKLFLISQASYYNKLYFSQQFLPYLQLNSKNFQIQRTTIINNYAQQGGGIFFEGDNNLNKTNFFQSLLLFNLATIQGNNIVETPSEITLYVNSLETLAYDIKINNKSYRILKIKPYHIIEQGKSKQTEFLLLPSNQEIQNFQIFNLKNQAYLSYINSMSIYFKNSKGEVLQNLVNSTCKVSETIITTSNDQINKSNLSKIISYDTLSNNFELSKFSFSFDPYQTFYNYLQIEISCTTQKSANQFNYIINSKSLKCQLGEFYMEEGCQICKQSQGFYSVTYDAINVQFLTKLNFRYFIQHDKFKFRILENYLSDYTEQCYKNLHYCQGGWGVGDQICKQGHKGALCEMCDIYNIRGDGKFFLNQQNLECISCLSNDSNILPVFFAFFQALLSILLSLKSINKSNQLFSSLRILQKFSKIIFKLTQDQEGILIKMLINYLWIYSAILTFNIDFSFQFVFIEQTSNSFYFMVNNLDCFLSDQKIQLIYIKIFVLQILMLLQFQIILTLSFIYHKLSKQKIDNSILSNTLLYLYVLNYGGLIKILCSSISSREISKIAYVQGDVSLNYNTQEHYLWIYFLIIPNLLIFGCFIPFFLFLLTYFNKDMLNKIKLRKHICYLFNEYNDDCYFWEQIKLLKKAIIILIITQFENNILLKASLLGLCLLIYQVLAVKNRPYIISKFNNLDIQSGQICSISFFLAATKHESEIQKDLFFSVFLQIILILLLIRLGFPFILNIAQVYYKKYIYTCLIKIYTFFKQLNFNLRPIRRLGEFIVKEMEKQNKLQSNFLKLRQSFLKSKNQTKQYLITYKQTHTRQNTNSGTMIFQITNR